MTCAPPTDLSAARGRRDGHSNSRFGFTFFAKVCWNGTKRSGRLFSLLIAVTLALILATVGLNLKDALIPPSYGPRIDVKGVLRKIEEAGLEPREAMYYRVVEEKGR